MQQVIIFMVALTATGAVAASSELADCAALTADGARLICYDTLAGRKPSGNVSEEAIPSSAKPPAATTGAATTATTGTAEATNDEIFVPPRLQEEAQNANNRFVIIPHNRNYLLPLTYNSNINEEAWKQQYPDVGMDQAEVKFQISFKAIIWEDLLGKDINLWGAYTQENWMQMYNTDASSPFRETDYQPELILSIPNDWHFMGVHNTRFDISFNHQSNGSSDPQSRSWNRVIASALLEHKNFSLATRAWYRVPEHNDDDNPDIDDYMGNGELQGLWMWPDYTLGFTLRNNLSSDNKGAIQLGWTFPLSRRFSGYIQYYNGYGESLIDYNESTNRIGIGVSLTDPF